MVFNSLQFFVFFAIVYGLYLVLDHRWQNRLLLTASFIFYAAWNWKFLFLLLFSVSTDFVCSQCMAKTTDKAHRRFFLIVSLSVNFALLGFFKYCNFFIHNALDMLKIFGIIGPSVEYSLKIILPLGISFYTFEAISYVVDVYKGVIQPAKSYWDYMLFVVYFPHLIAGPIMRAKDFLPQITRPRQIRFDQVMEGCQLFFWGLFEKILLADNLAKIAGPVFDSPGPYHASAVLFAVYAFAFQIFCDFDGYSNMARGLGKFMGFEITINFMTPYFATNPREFWQRWHISLSSWLRDYLYIPLGGNRNGFAPTCGNILITMLLGGLWHGASWTFFWWGLYHGLLLVFNHLTKEFWPGLGKFLERVWRPVKIIFFFHLVCLGWLLFRAHSMAQVFQILSTLAFHFNLGMLARVPFAFMGILVLLLVQMLQYRHNDLMYMFKIAPWKKGLFYFVCLFLIIIFGVTGAQEFIYFQF